MTTIKAIRMASLVTASNVLVASGFAIAAIIRPQYFLSPIVSDKIISLLSAYCRGDC